jgi:ectoine hydroxylase-related dioxygenase (phytanoyl-CoA dioxygenase family)
MQAQKGDVLIWSADLALGGSKNPRAGVTRRSLVSHYCPTKCQAIDELNGKAAGVLIWESRPRIPTSDA